MATLYVEDGYTNKGYIQTGITIDWGTGVIFVPKSEMTLVQETPTEIYELELNAFRLTLKDLEDDAEGMPYPITHIHNTEVSLGGLTYARVIEVVEPYTVTFEDGKYAVNLVGANSNVGDRVNVNNVSVRSANSAGMTSSPDIEYSSFNGIVTIDVTTNNTGTAFPTGTPRRPVNNIADARLIRAYRGLPPKLGIIGNITIGADDNINNYELQGQEPTKTTITVLEESESYGCVFTDCMLTGTLDGNSTVKDSVVYDLNYINGFVYNCLISEVGEITLGGAVKAYFLNCYSGKGAVHGDGFPTINCDGEGTILVIYNYNGDISIKNKTGNEAGVINLNAGAIEIQASCVAGTIECQGTGSLEDYSGVGCIVYAEDLMNSTNIASAVWNESISDHLIPGSTGLSIGTSEFGKVVTVDVINGVSGTTFPTGTEHVPVDNIVDAKTIAIANGISEFSIKGNITIDNGEDISGYEVRGVSVEFTTVTMVSGSNVDDVIFSNCTIEGAIDANITLYNCRLLTVTGFRGSIYDTLIEGNIYLAGNESTTLLNCWRGEKIPIGIPPIIDMGGAGQQLALRAYTGGIEIRNFDDPTGRLSIDLLSGKVLLHDTITGNGEVVVRGVGQLFNNSSSTNIDITGIVNKDTVSVAVWSIPLNDFNTYGTMGSGMNDISYTEKRIYINTELVSNGNGKMSEPFNNVADAVDFAESVGWSILVMLADATLERNLRNFTIEGIGLPTVNLNGQNTDNTEFHNVQLIGTQVGSIVAENCVLLDGIAGINGTYKSVGIIGDISLAEDSYVNMVSACILFQPNTTVPTIIDMGVANTNVNLNMRKTSGAITIKNVNTATKLATLEFAGGRLYIDNTNTAGVVALTGLVDSSVFDTSAGTTVNDFGLYPSALTISDTVWDDIDAVQLVSDVDFIKNIEGGRWIINNNQMVFFTDDNITEVARFNLFDGSGNPTETNVLERIRI